MALFAMSVVGIVVALVHRRPGESFEGLSFAFCVATILFAVLLYWGGRIANRTKLVVDIPPKTRYVPGSIFGTVFLFLPLMLFAMALSAAPDSYSDVDRFFLIWMVLILAIGVGWDVVAWRRSILDGAWNRNQSSTTGA